VTPSTESNVKNFLKSIHLPGISQTLGEVGRITEAELADGRATVKIELGFPAESAFAAWRDDIAEAIKSEVGASAVDVELSSAIVSHGVQRNLKPMPEVKNVIAVASGKGGVGKSTVAVNLALALAADGATVGLLDADIYGPSQPHMVGLVGERPTSDDGKTMNPIEALGLQVMSIGFLVDADEPMAWRGPMVTSALSQLLHQTEWHALDYLIVDMPPGTGDIQLTLSQQVPVSGAVIVTTPQDIAAIDARKGLAMFQKVSIPVLGVIENMSTHICTNCGHEEPIFGAGGGDSIASDFDVDLASDPESAAAEAYRSTARQMAASLAVLGKDYSAKFPKIVIE
jgi:ATP-binding protein involved in chromosome partitioning